MLFCLINITQCNLDIDMFLRSHWELFPHHHNATDELRHEAMRHLAYTGYGSSRGSCLIGLLIYMLLDSLTSTSSASVYDHGTIVKMLGFLKAFKSA